MSSLASYAWEWWTSPTMEEGSEGKWWAHEAQGRMQGVTTAIAPQWAHLNTNKTALVLITSWISWVDQLIHWVFPELIKKVWMSSWFCKISVGKGYTWLSTEYENWMINKMNFKESNMLELASTCAFLPCDWGCQTWWKSPQGDRKW